MTLQKIKTRLTRLIHDLEKLQNTEEAITALLSARNFLNGKLVTETNKQPKKHLKTRHSAFKNKRRGADRLWADIIKARAGYKSEISGKTENLQAHHVHKKPNLALRYSLDNGICLTAGEHLRFAHGPDSYAWRDKFTNNYGKLGNNSAVMLRLLHSTKPKKIDFYFTILEKIHREVCG